MTIVKKLDLKLVDSLGVQLLFSIANVLTDGFSFKSIFKKLAFCVLNVSGGLVHSLSVS